MPKPPPVSSAVTGLDVVALDSLKRLVAHIDHQMRQTPPDDYPGNVNRTRCIELQRSIGKFFGSIGLRDIEREFFKFALALDDLDNGTVHQMLKPGKKRPKGGRPLDRSEIWVARAGVAAAAQCFLAANLSQKRVIMRILEREKEIAMLVRTGATIDLSVFSWLKHFKKKKVPAGARGGWESYSSDIDKFREYIGEPGKSIVASTVVWETSPIDKTADAALQAADAKANGSASAGNEAEKFLKEIVAGGRSRRRRLRPPPKAAGWLGRPFGGPRTGSVSNPTRTAWTAGGFGHCRRCSRSPHLFRTG
jgi:hypothetical protein